MSTPRYIRWFDQIGIGDVPLVGGKNASLGEMYRALAPKGVRVPNGFAITAEGYRFFLRSAGLSINELLSGLNTGDLENLRVRGSKVRHAIRAAILPAEMDE